MSVDKNLITNLLADEEKHVKEIADKCKAMIDENKVSQNICPEDTCIEYVTNAVKQGLSLF